MINWFRIGDLSETRIDLRQLLILAREASKSDCKINSAIWSRSNWVIGSIASGEGTGANSNGLINGSCICYGA